VASELGSEVVSELGSERNGLVPNTLFQMSDPMVLSYVLN
jgi:hypothetical protein